MDLSQRRLGGLAVVLACASFASAVRADTVPDLSGIYIHNRVAHGDPVPPGGWPKGFTGTISPIRAVPRPGQTDYGQRAGDYSDPILKPWAAAVVKRLGDDDAAGKITARNPALCKPDGPIYLMTREGTRQVVQTASKIVILFDQDYQSRTVYLNAPHPAHLKPSWQGHSIGHWEGQTLVVDTIGFNDKSEVDTFGTPHSEQMHLVERITAFNDGKAIVDRFTVDDPGAYTRAWTGIVSMAKTDAVNPEFVCEENNRFH